jgi:hypothetical protein
VSPRDGIRMGVPTYWSAGDRNNFEQLPENSLITDIEGFIVLVKNINEVKPHYEKLFGVSTATSANELFYQLQHNFVQIIQPESLSAYQIILNERGEGIQVLVVNPRQKTQQDNEAVFRQKGFAIINIDSKNTLFTKDEMPFQIQIKL